MRDADLEEFRLQGIAAAQATADNFADGPAERLAGFGVPGFVFASPAVICSPMISPKFLQGAWPAADPIPADATPVKP